MRQRSGFCATRIIRLFRKHWLRAIWSVSRRKASEFMASTFRLLLGGSPASEDLYTQMTSLEVEENADLPGAIQLNLPVNGTSAGDFTFVNDNALKPFASIAVVVKVEGKADECIFDGFVLSHKLHLQTGTTASTLQ